jgi:hypothetical protein
MRESYESGDKLIQNGHTSLYHVQEVPQGRDFALCFPNILLLVPLLSQHSPSFIIIIIRQSGGVFLVKWSGLLRGTNRPDGNGCHRS